MNATTSDINPTTMTIGTIDSSESAISTPRTMRAIVQAAYGTADVLELRETDTPATKDNEVLIRVRAAGVNPADWAITGGLPYIARPVYGGMRAPKNRVRGTDVAGDVAAVGAGVTRFRPSDAVFGCSNGAFAEYASASEDKLVSKPANVTYEQAAAVPMAGLVALQAIRDHAGIQPGQRILVNGGSGGIGTFAVQIAKVLGANVTAVCSTRNVNMVRSIGADRVLDYTREDFTQDVQRYDLILDNVGNHSVSALRRMLTPTGVLVPNSGGFDNRWFASAGRLITAAVSFRFASQRLGRFVMSPKREDLLGLRDWIESGEVTPVVDRTYSLDDTAKSIAYVGAGHAQGKVVVTVQPAITAAPA